MFDILGNKEKFINSNFLMTILIVLILSIIGIFIIEYFKYKFYHNKRKLQIQENFLFEWKKYGKLLNIEFLLFLIILLSIIIYTYFTVF